jgi:hypothetical protein
MLALALALVAGSAAAQDTTTAVRPGMTEADVINRWGEPVAIRRLNDWTYLFFTNDCERECGYYDVVFLQNGQVVDAIVRSPLHMYLGQSSSPPERLPAFTPPRTQPDAPGAQGEVTGVRVSPAPPAPAPAAPAGSTRPDRER